MTSWLGACVISCCGRGVKCTGSDTRWREAMDSAKVSSSSAQLSSTSGSRISRASTPTSAMTRPMSWPGHS